MSITIDRVSHTCLKYLFKVVNFSKIKSEVR